MPPRVTESPLSERLLEPKINGGPGEEEEEGQESTGGRVDVSNMDDFEYLRYCVIQIFFTSKLNILLVCMPAAIACKVLDVGAAPTFVFALVALCPLAERLGFVTEQVAGNTNETIGGLLNATFGNLTEVIVSAFALRHGLLRIIQLSLLGSVLSNLLLVMGTAFLLGGCRWRSQFYDADLSNNNVFLLMLAALSILLPTMMAASGEQRTDNDTLVFSRVVSVGLFMLYLCYLAFQLATHQDEFDEASERRSPARLWPWALRKRNLRRALTRGRQTGTADSASSTLVADQAGTSSDLENGGSGDLVRDDSLVLDDNDADDEDEEQFMTTGAGVFWLSVITVGIAVMSEFVVDTIQEASEGLGIPLPFISTIILPIAGNAAEHASALIFAWKNRMELALGVAVGSATQISVMVIPVMILLSWMVGKPLSLDFALFECSALMGTILFVAIILRDGKAHWLKGAALVMLYIMLGTGFWVRLDPQLMSGQ